MKTTVAFFAAVSMVTAIGVDALAASSPTVKKPTTPTAKWTCQQWVQTCRPATGHCNNPNKLVTPDCKVRGHA
jgi:hypothetical protein